MEYVGEQDRDVAVTGVIKKIGLDVDWGLRK
jgi:hypothetical protein